MSLKTNIILLILGILTFSCSDKEESIPPFLTIENKTISFNADVSSRSIHVKTSVENWTATVQGDAGTWLTARPENSLLRISALENNELDVRRGEIKVIAGTLTETIVVEQLGVAPAILVTTELYSLSANQSDIMLEITSNVEYDIVIPAEATWIKVKPEARSGEMVKKEHWYRVASNTKNEERSTEITIKQKNGTIEKKITVTQKGYTGNAADVEVPKDIKVQPTSGKANQFQPGQNIENTFDGVFGGEPYHSPWGDGTTMPVILEYFFDGTGTAPEVIDYIVYHTRSGNGNFGKLKLYVATQTEPDYRLYGDYDFKETSSPSKITFNNGLKKPTKIKFEVLSGLGGFASCDEMEFFKVNQEDALRVQLLSVFTDISCSELKAGVTEEQINALPVFFGTMAASMKNGNYPRDFRIAQYHAYSITEEWAEKLIINKRGVLDNCTGIYGEANEEIIVLVGNTNGNQLKLRCIEDGSYAGSDYMLNEGVNKITLRNKGLFYIMYNVSNIQSPTATPITVHFPMHSGKVNGYWDINVHKTDAKYKELLAAATYPYFDVKGNHMILKFSTVNGFRKYVPNNIIATINFWDEMVTWQQSLMGWEGIYPEQMNNRMYARSTPEGYMSAQDYQTNFGEGALYKILNPTVMRQNEDDPWGPAHEIGHMNQGAINWVGNTETSNNLFANLIHHKMTSFPTRGENIEQNVKALLVEKRVYTNTGVYDGGDVGYASLRMNWQLYSYFHWLKNDERFFPKLFIISRESGRRPIHNNPGWSQLNYVRNACDAAKLDLTEFFEFWGFFRPINIEINQYYKAQLTVTQTMIDETIDYVKSKGYAKPKYPIQYIEDRADTKYGNVGKISQFQAQKPITKTITYSRSGNTISISNGDEAVCFEVRKDDKVIFFSNKYSFTLPNGWWTDDCNVYAVQSDGKAILLDK